MIALLAAVTALFGAAAPAISAPVAPQQEQQVLTWTAGNSVSEYTSAPATAEAGTVSVIFDNSVAAGNTSGMPHTLTFDTSTEGYNHDVDLNITANPHDANEGYYEAEITLTEGTYRYFCAIPGHGMMWGELVVTGDGGGDPGEDTTAPEVAAQVAGEQDEDGAYLGAAEVTITATDDDSGVESVEYSLDGGEYVAYEEPVSVAEVGEHTVDFRATDVAGNTAEDSVSFTVVEGEPDPGEDTTAPEVAAQVAGEQDEDGAYLGAAEVTITASDDDSGVESVEYSLDGGEYVAYEEPVSVAEVGEHTVDFRATDVAGNSAEDSVSFTVVEGEPDPGEDTTAPEVAAQIAGEQDEDGAYVGSAEVTIAATDADSGVESVEYSLDGGEYTHYHAPVTVSDVGEHTVDFRATDVAGNSAEDSVSFTVVEGEPDPGEDTTAPEVAAQIAGEQDEDGAYVGSAEVTITATDADSGVESVEYSLNGGEYVAYEEPVSVAEVGEHTVDFRATDVAGNTAEDSVSFTVVEGDTDPGECPDTRETVIIGDLDTGVANADLGDGCTINDRIDEGGDYASHGAFVRHVGAIVQPLAADGVISPRDAGAIVRTAGASAIGK